jgi:hypothetical protein
MRFLSAVRFAEPDGGGTDEQSNGDDKKGVVERHDERLAGNE